MILTFDDVDLIFPPATNSFAPLPYLARVISSTPRGAILLKAKSCYNQKNLFYGRSTTQQIFLVSRFFDEMNLPLRSGSSSAYEPVLLGSKHGFISLSHELSRRVFLDQEK